MAAPASQHQWKFSRYGGFDQARLDTGADIGAIGQLDLKLWAALACPVKGLEFDERTLSLLDTDQDGRVRAGEVIEAVAWCRGRLKDLGSLKAGSDSLPLALIDDSTEGGRTILASARLILKDLGSPTSDAVRLADVSDTAKIFASTRFNGDGIVPVDAAEDAATRKVIEDVAACMGSLPDRSGKPGVDQAKVDQFFAEVAALREWLAKSEAAAVVRPFGEATGAAADAWRAVRAKVDDFFARGRLAEFDGRALAAVNRREEEFLAIAAKDMAITSPEVAALPLARVEPGRAMPLSGGVNPAWAGAIEALRSAAVVPLFGAAKDSLTADEWALVGAKLAPHEDWLRAKPATAVEKLGFPRIREIAAAKAKDAITALLDQDRALEPEARAIAEVERLVRYHRDLYRLLHNFVNFADFYSPDRLATFQAGTLYLDARGCELCVRVDDAAKHAALAGFAKAYLAYCDCSRPSGEKMQIAAAFTAGDADYLMVGRNGIFYDRKGRDWDATIVRIVENPISVRQAFWSPYKKLVRIIDEFAAKRAAAAEAANDAKLAAAATAPGAPPPVDKPPEAKKIDIGTVAALGVAFGAIGSMLTALIGYAVGLFTLPFWKVCLVIGGVILLISSIPMLIAWLKLRQRNMGPILDANGWAVNGRVKMNVKFGGSLTAIARLPEGAVITADPFAQKRSPWPRIVLAVVVVCVVYSFLADPDHGWLYEWTKPGTEFHRSVGLTLGERKKTDEEKKADEEARKALEVK